MPLSTRTCFKNYTEFSVKPISLGGSIDKNISGKEVQYMKYLIVSLSESRSSVSNVYIVTFNDIATAFSNF